MAPSATLDVAPSNDVEATTSPLVDGPVSPYDPARPLAGKVALITGSGRGIGRGIAIELGRRGANVVVNYGSSSKAAEEVVAELAKLGSKSIALQADISNPAAVSELFEKAVEHFGHLDIVVSNSGMEVWCPEVEVTPELFDKVFNLNCRGQFFVAQQGLKHCSRGGRIILTSSIAASIGGIPNHALYAGSKAAVEGFTRAFAVDCGEKGITVNAIAPGGVKTDMYDENSWHYVPGGYKGMPMEIIDAGLAKMCPLKRVGTPADIGKAVFTLCSEEGEWINGTSLFSSFSNKIHQTDGVTAQVKSSNSPVAMLFRDIQLPLGLLAWDMRHKQLNAV
ncbi:putative versicolorin reductase protein [Phaeoacremonium minimum UCRPA7]|uniref:Putative versicolorin reductase protein n=1 Tax=Phaeoacremonium minimum (strain UCR-PA7) TaxID=1286976 RepID=R8BTI6_PHAM7|nr:putative versicolorin reductase protein [Phaeoacremonium minimum UCRPA7]EOO02666.1 putative versicolorin reductase protein [Phaeoacremonium minimum UCRPA7]